MPTELTRDELEKVYNEGMRLFQKVHDCESKDMDGDIKPECFFFTPCKTCKDDLLMISSLEKLIGLKQGSSHRKGFSYAPLNEVKGGQGKRARKQRVCLGVADYVCPVWSDLEESE